ncbi:MAG: sugar transferase [Bacteroidales bacterium]|nr:sugar transferase [Bacteroidales bacterium]
MPGIKSLSHSVSKGSLKGKSAYNIEKLMVVVDEEHLDMLDELMLKDKWGIQVVYILTDSPTVREIFPGHSRIYPTKANIRSLLRFDIIDEIVCCTSSLSEDYLHELTEICSQYGVSLLIQQNLSSPRVPVSGYRFIADFYFQVLETNPRRRFGFVLKSMAEMTFAFFVLFMLSPFLIMVALVIKQTSSGPVLFKQQRVGLRGRKFYIYKFRTMVVDAEKQKASLAAYNESDGPAFKIANDPRITPFGKFLRKTGLDEVPQLYNVMKGEMSLIGPRPMLPDEVKEQKEWQLKRMCIKPGITCTWQIQRDRNKVPFDQWMQLDRDYVENWSLGEDMKIFMGTVRSVFAARGL